MPKAIVVEDEQLEHAVKVARVSSPENGIRDSALLFACFGTGMTVTELCLLRVSDYLAEDGDVLRDSLVRAEIAYNHKPRPLCWTYEPSSRATCSDSSISSNSLEVNPFENAGLSTLAFPWQQGQMIHLSFFIECSSAVQ